MSKMVVIALLAVISHIIIVSTAMPEPIGIVYTIDAKEKENVMIFTEKDKKAKPVEVSMVIFPGDKIITNKDSKVTIKHGTVIYELQENTVLKLINRLIKHLENGTLVLINPPPGEIIETRYINAAPQGTHIIISTNSNGTAVDVIDGQVELERNEEKVGNITRDCQALVLSDSTLLVNTFSSLYSVNPTLLHTLTFTNAIMPFIPQVYTRRDIYKSIVSKSISALSLAGFLTFNSKREDYIINKNRTYDKDYLNAKDPEMIDEYYSRHKQYTEKAKRYRKYQLICGAVYAVCVVYELNVARKSLNSYRQHRKMIQKIKTIENSIRNSNVNLEVINDAVIITKMWNF